MLQLIKKIFSSAESPDLGEAIKNGAFMVDVRTPVEFAAGHPKGAINIPLDKVEASIAKFRNKENIIVFCRSGNRSAQAKKILENNGINQVINGGTWENIAKFTG